jgi:hypothetical protein
MVSECSLVHIAKAEALMVNVDAGTTRAVSMVPMNAPLSIFCNVAGSSIEFRAASPRNALVPMVSRADPEGKVTDASLGQFIKLLAAMDVRAAGKAMLLSLTQLWHNCGLNIVTGASVPI